MADIVRAIEQLSGATFERFGNRIVEHIHPAQWLHRGTNIGVAPGLQHCRQLRGRRYEQPAHGCLSS